MLGYFLAQIVGEFFGALTRQQLARLVRDIGLLTEPLDLMALLFGHGIVVSVQGHVSTSNSTRETGDHELAGAFCRSARSEGTSEVSVAVSSGRCRCRAAPHAASMPRGKPVRAL